MNGKYAQIRQAVGCYYTENIDKTLKTTDEMRKIVASFSPRGEPEYGDIYDLVSLCERLTGDNKQKGAFFTPHGLSSYIAKTVDRCENVRIMDPSCGCGSILIACVRRLHKELNLNPVEAVSEYVYGIDIDEFHVYVCKLLLELTCLELGYETEGIEFHIACEDSLRSDWFGLTYDYILGNPPYVDIHMIDECEKKRYEKDFKTAKGLYNLSFLFFEKAIRYLSENGKLTFLSISSILHSNGAKNTRTLIDKENLLEEVIDLSEHKIFGASVKICIIKLNKTPHTHVLYVKLNPDEDPEEMLDKKPRVHSLNWIGTTRELERSLSDIERFPLKLGSYLCGGLATLCDDAFMVGDSMEKTVGGTVYKIEPNAVVPCLKVPKRVDQWIIYPYKEDMTPYTEIEMEERFPNTYRYLLSVKDLLLRRDKGKPNPDGWFAYGRRQSLQTSSKILVSGAYNNQPSFYIPRCSETLIVGGIGIKNSIPMDLEVLQAVLNSRIMQMYVEAKSYALIGGYWLYNRRVLQNFSIPDFSEAEKAVLRSADKKTSDELLREKYLNQKEELYHA